MSTVLHVLAPGPTGGMESVVRLLTAALVEGGHEVHAHVILEPGPEPEVVSHLRTAGVGVHVSEIPGRRYDRERAETRRLCREYGVEAVHCHGYRADVVDAGAARAEGVPVVSTVHGFTGGGWKNAIYEWLQIRALRSLDRVIAVSAPLADLLRSRGVPDPRIVVLPNAYAAPDEPSSRSEARAVLGLDSDATVIGCPPSSRHVPVKAPGETAVASAPRRPVYRAPCSVAHLRRAHESSGFLRVSRPRWRTPRW